MKRLTTALVCLCLMATTTANAQTIKDFFDRYSQDERFDYVSIGREMIGLAGVFSAADTTAMNTLSRISGMRILTLTDGFDDSLMQDVRQEAEALVRNGHFDTLAEVRSGGERVNVYRRTATEGDDDLLVVTQDEAELTLIWIQGKLSAEELMGLMQ